MRQPALLNFLLSLLLLTTTLPAMGQLTAARVDSAIEAANANTDLSDGDRQTLLNSYREIQGHLDATADLQERQTGYKHAQENADSEALALRAELEALETSPPPPWKPDEDGVNLEALEQRLQVDRANAASKELRLQDLESEIEKVTDRPGQIRDRLTQLGVAQSELGERLAVTAVSGDAGSAEEARRWVLEAQASHNTAEKAALDLELLSQPMRLELLEAQRDRLSFDLDRLREQLAAMEHHASELRKGQAEQAQAETETAQADALGKHELVQQLADSNAEFGADLAGRSAAIEQIRTREASLKDQAEVLENDLSTIERKLEILGMTKSVGDVLREQTAYLPSRRSAAREVAEIADLIADSSLRHVELEDEQRQLRDPDARVVSLTEGLKPRVVSRISPDLEELVRSRRDLVNQAIDLENTYARALSDLDVAVHRYADSVELYNDFVSERLLWIQSRDPISAEMLARLPIQVAELFKPSAWLLLLRSVVDSASRQPAWLLVLVLVAALIYLKPALVRRLLATSEHVGDPRRDDFGNTAQALLITLILTLKWPLLLLGLSIPLAYGEPDSQLAVAMHRALRETGLYFLGLEYLRWMMYPRGLVQSHFRWPAERVSRQHRRISRFELTFIPATYVALFSYAYYPTSVGGALGTASVIVMLLSMSHFFRTSPDVIQDKMEAWFAEPRARYNSVIGKLLRFMLTWVPLAAIVGVLFGYSYTAIEFSLLMIQTVILFGVLLMLHEMGYRWLRLTRRRLRMKEQQEEAQAAPPEEGALVLDEDSFVTDSELLDDAGTKMLNALLIAGALLGIAVVWAGVFPALRILDSLELWYRQGVVDGQDTLIPVTLGSLLFALALGLLGWVAARRLPSLLEILLRQKVEVAPATAYAMARVLQYSLTIIVFIAVMTMLGTNWSQIQWAVAALSVGIGFGLQEIVANFVSGLIILFEQPVRVGDTVTVGQTTGIVTRIRMRATTIRDWDNRELLVPNKEFVTGRLLNWSLSDRISRLHITVGVAYGSDIPRSLALILQAANEHPSVLSDPAPFTTFDDFADSSLLISLRCCIEELDRRLSTSSEIRLRISELLSEAGIEVAFPQRDVHLDASEPLNIRLHQPIPQ